MTEQVNMPGPTSGLCDSHPNHYIEQWHCPQTIWVALVRGSRCDSDSQTTLAPLHSATLGSPYSTLRAQLLSIRLISACSLTACSISTDRLCLLIRVCALVCGTLTASTSDSSHPFESNYRQENGDIPRRAHSTQPLNVPLSYPVQSNSSLLDSNTLAITI